MRVQRLICVFALMVAASFYIHAQTFYAVDVHFPFTVMAGTKELPPGDYVIRPTGAQDVLAVYDDGGTHLETVMLAMPAGQTASSSKTVFELRGGAGVYALDHLWFEGETTGYEFLKPKAWESRQHERNVTVETPAVKVE
jgi:hypothetical protein